MRRYWFLTGFLLGLFLILFFVFQALHIPLFSDPTPWLKEAGPLAMLVGIGLLIADVLLPIPSSVIMVAHGALFGPIIGSLLSLVGCLGAVSFAFFLGRRGDKVLERMVTPPEKAKADALLARFGALAVLVTRPLPLLAETVALLAGASSMKWSRMLIAALLGSIPPSILYAFAGATTHAVSSGLIMFALVIALAGIFWWIGKKVS
jgi:uncharacterized membrane protein YdjX (TVP38/TMEM64 family)